MGRGQITLRLSLALVFIIIFVILLGALVFTVHTIRTNLSIDVDVGGVNLINVTEATFGVMDDAFMEGADELGVMVLFATVFAMLGSAYFLQGKFHRLVIPVEIVILVVMFIVSVYIAIIYNTFVLEADMLSDIYRDTLPKTSKFVLNLPVITTIVGVLMIVINHIKIRGKDEGTNVLGFN